MKRALLIAVLVLASSVPALGQVNGATPGWFPFTFPGYDSSPTAIDLSYLNAKPAGRDGFLRAQGGVIRDGAGRRLRWFGVNFAGLANFPDKTLAPVLAARLAKIGVNIVRLHAMDGPGALLNASNTGLDFATLDRLDFFISELKKQGIYVNLNLHVIRTYPVTPAAYQYSKGLDLFYPPYINSFKDYARALLTHFNPYTGAAYAQEPAIACIEVSNEDTLGIYSPVQLANLPEPFASELRRQWITWLRTKYVTTDALRAAWGVNDGQIGPNLIPNPDFANNGQGWTLINNPGGASYLTPLPDGTPGVRWVVTQTGTQSWSVRIYALHLNLAEGFPYRLQLRARSDASRPFTVAAELDENYKSGVVVGLWTLATLTPTWQNLSYTFTATVAVPNHVMVILDPQNQLGVFDLAGVTLQRLPGGALQPDQTFENNNIPFTPASSIPTAQRDFTEFLVETERGTAQELHRFLKQDLGAQQMIYQSQLEYGGMAGAIREVQTSDLADTHGYWQHPVFPGSFGDPSNWFIPNTSQIANPTGGMLAGMAIQRVGGMPFTVSEYNTPAPNDFSAETWPMLSSVASFQDWDGIYFFDYTATNSDYAADHIRGWFEMQGHPAQEAFTPLAALLFRTGMVRPSVQPVVLTAAEGSIIADQTSSGIGSSFDRFWGQAGLTPAVALLHRTALSLVPGSAPTQASFLPTLPPTGPLISDTGEIAWDASQQVMTLNAPAARLLLGRVGGRGFSLGGVGFQVGSLGGNEHAHLGLIALDGQPIATSRQLLLVALGRAENQNMGWNASRTSVGNQWGTGPAVVQGVSGTVSLSQGSWNVVTLDPTGAPVQTVATGVSSFRIDPSYRTVWYLLSRVP